MILIQVSKSIRTIVTRFSQQSMLLSPSLMVVGVVNMHYVKGSENPRGEGEVLSLYCALNRDINLTVSMTFHENLYLWI